MGQMEGYIVLESKDLFLKIKWAMHTNKKILSNGAYVYESTDFFKRLDPCNNILFSVSRECYSFTS